MQKLWKSEVSSGPEHLYKSHKDSPYKESFFKDTFFTRNICRYRFRKNFICIFEKNLVNVAMRMAEAFYNIFMYLYNKNILEYGQIARNGTESIIPDTEGHSNIYPYRYNTEIWKSPGLWSGSPGICDSNSEHLSL